MSDAEIISIQLLIECIDKSQNSGYLYLKANYPELVNYAEHSRFNRLISALFTVIKMIRKRIPKNEASECKVADSFPLVVNKFGRDLLRKEIKRIL